MKRTVIAVLLLLSVGLSTGCSGGQAGAADKATSQQASSLPESAQASQAAAQTSAPAAPAVPAFIEGTPDKGNFVTNATITKVRNVNELDARVRLAVMIWVKPSTGEKVSNVIVCQADRHDCERLEVGGSYTVAWPPRGKNTTYDVYGLQGYQTVILATGLYADMLRGKNTHRMPTLITPYAVMDLSKGKANNLREWATE